MRAMLGEEALERPPKLGIAVQQLAARRFRRCTSEDGDSIFQQHGLPQHGIGKQRINGMRRVGEQAEEGQHDPSKRGNGIGDFARTRRGVGKVPFEPCGFAGQIPDLASRDDAGIGPFASAPGYWMCLTPFPQPCEANAAMDPDCGAAPRDIVRVGLKKDSKRQIAIGPCQLRPTLPKYEAVILQFRKRSVTGADILAALEEVRRQVEQSGAA